MESLTPNQIKIFLGGELVNANKKLINEANSLSLAEANSVAFFHNNRYEEDLSISKAGLIIVEENFNICDKRCYLKHKNPLEAFYKISEKFALKIKYEVGINPTAIIHKSVKIGKDVYIGAYVVIDANCVIGDEVSILPHTYIAEDSCIDEGTFIYSSVSIRERTKIGKRCIIHCNTVIGSDGFGFIFENNRHRKISQVGNVVIEDDVEIGAQVAIDRARFTSTVIGEGTKIDNLVQVAHNVKIGKHCLIISQVGIAGSAELGDFVTIAGQVGIIGHIKISNGVTVLGKSVVTKNLSEGVTVSGNPATSRRENVARINAHKSIKKLEKLVKRLEK